MNYELNLSLITQIELRKCFSTFPNIFASNNLSVK